MFIEHCTAIFLWFVYARLWGAKFVIRELICNGYDMYSQLTLWYRFGYNTGIKLDWTFNKLVFTSYWQVTDLKFNNCSYLYYCRFRFHDSVIIWKCFQHHWPFVRGIHWSKMDFPLKGSNLYAIFVGSLKKLLIKQFPIIWDVLPFMWHQHNVCQTTPITPHFSKHSSSINWTETRLTFHKKYHLQAMVLWVSWKYSHCPCYNQT